MVTPVPVSIATHSAARTAAHSRVSSVSGTSAKPAVCSSVNGSTAAVRCVETLNRHILLHAVVQNLADQVCQHRVVGAGPRRQVAGGQSRGLRAARVDHPHLPAVGDVADRAASGSASRSRGRAEITGLTPTSIRKSALSRSVRPRQPHESTHQVRDQRLGGAVDGERAELRRGADRRVQRFGHPETRALHGAEVEGDRLGPVPVDDAFQLRAQVVEAGRPTWCPAAGRRPASAVVPDGRGDGAAAAAPDPWRRCTRSRTGGPGRRERGAPHLLRRRRGFRRRTCRRGRSYAPFAYCDNVLSPSEKQHCIFENDCAHLRMQFP